jgi:hypothetical protein
MGGYYFIGAIIMNVKKNQCSACGYNFFTETLFFEHRVGKYPSENQGTSTRSCLTEAEMHEKGWQCQELQVTVWVEGDKTTVPMQTWVRPGQLEAREKRAEHLKIVRYHRGQK